MTRDGAQELGQVHQDEPPKDHPAAPSRRVLAALSGAFAVFAGITISTGHADGTWGVWGFGAYAVTALLFLLPTGWVIPLATAVGGALVAPLFWLITTYPPTGEVVVLGTSATYMVKHGTPYLPQNMLTGWMSYNPYLPLMEMFGLPRSAGLTGVVADERVWTTLFTLVTVAIAFAVVSPHPVRGCRACRWRLAGLTAVAVASPVLAYPLSVGATDPPVIALTCLTLALASRNKFAWAAAALALACAMKTTAWAVVPVLAVMAWVRFAPRVAARFTTISVGLTALLVLLAAPDALATPEAVKSVKQNLIDYPMGRTKYKTPAESPLPGHLIADLGSAWHAVALALLVVAIVAFVGWLLIRPPRDARDATIRLAVGYAVVFALDPSTRFGYYAYPLALLGWLALQKLSSPAAPLVTSRWRPSRFI